MVEKIVKAKYLLVVLVVLGFVQTTSFELLDLRSDSLFALIVGKLSGSVLERLRFVVF